MSKILLPIIAIIAVVIISGCTGGTGAIVNPNAGVVINNFVSTPSEVLEGDPVVFEAEIQNVGGTTARSTTIELFGVEGTWRNRDGSVIESTLPEEFGRLDPAIVERNLPGDMRIKQWEIVPPAIGQGITVPFSIETRVTYDYNTSGFLQVVAITEDEFQRQRIQGVSPNPPVVQNSAGPIQLTVPTADQYQYIVVDTTSDEDTFVYPFRIRFTNAGTGFPVTEEAEGFIGGGGRLSGTIQLLGPGVEFEDCLGVSGETEINLDDTDVLPRIREDQTTDVACSVRFDLDTWRTRPTDTVTFLFNIFYTYYERAQLTVTVVGR